jgi:hypothetical protein
VRASVSRFLLDNFYFARVVSFSLSLLQIGFLCQLDFIPVGFRVRFFRPFFFASSRLLDMGGKTGDFEAVRRDIVKLLHQPEYDDGSAGPVLVRLAW